MQHRTNTNPTAWRVFNACAKSHRPCFSSNGQLLQICTAIVNLVGNWCLDTQNRNHLDKEPPEETHTWLLKYCPCKPTIYRFAIIQLKGRSLVFYFCLLFLLLTEAFFGLSSVGETKLHIACIKNDPAKVKQLLAAGEDANSVDYVGWTPLHEACNHGHLECVRVLLKNRQPVLEINSEDGMSCFQ